MLQNLKDATQALISPHKWALYSGDQQQELLKKNDKNYRVQENKGY